MENGVQELLQMLTTMISDAKNVPLSSERCILDREKALDLLDEIKAQLPNELGEARRLVTARNEFIGSAKREADSIRKVAEERARQLVDEEEILKMARAQSANILATAESKSNELRRIANDYAEDILRRTEESIANALSQIQQSRKQFLAATQPSEAAKEEQAVYDDLDE
jgi:cell division septum initiation protein DivIVA